MRLQLIEDHPRLASFVKKGLEAANFTVDVFSRGDEALLAFDTVHYDAVILDLGLPDQDGLSVLRSMRRSGRTLPVLILTSRVQVADRVKGLDAGADDYMVKPFAMEELIARLHALLRRPASTLGPILETGNLAFDVGASEIRVDGTLLALTRREIGLAEQLMRRSGKVVPRSSIEDAMFGFGDEQTPNSIDVMVHRLRKKLADAGADVKIRTVRGVGYMMTAGEPGAATDGGQKTARSS